MFLLIMPLSGCATVYHVRVNGYLDATSTKIFIASGASFFVNIDKDVKNPIFENEIKSKIENLLTQKGYSIGSYEKAEFFLEFVYSMSAGRLAAEVTPVYHSGGIDRVRTYASDGNQSVSYIEYPGYTAYIPHKFTVYTASLTLEVLDAVLERNSAQKKKLWIGEASNTSENPDIRGAINYLLVAAFDHFGENTHISVTADVSGDNPRLKELLAR